MHTGRTRAPKKFADWHGIAASARWPEVVKTAGITPQ
jgi:hypothetical protein